MLRAARRVLLAVGLLSAGLACQPQFGIEGGMLADTAQHHTPRELPEASFGGAGPDGSLLDEYKERDFLTEEELDELFLPGKSKRLVVGLMIAAAHDDVHELEAVLTQDARWGFPDTRELGALPIHDDDQGVAFLTAFRKAASRLGAKAGFTCPPLTNGLEQLAQAGAEPMWCFFASKDGQDGLLFRMREDAGVSRIDYVGFFRERPTVPPGRYMAMGRPAPLVPPMKRSASSLNPGAQRGTPRPRPQVRPQPVRPPTE